MPRRRQAALCGAAAIRAGRASWLPLVSPIRSLDPPRMDGTNILLSGICVLPNGDRHGCRHPGLAEDAALRGRTAGENVGCGHTANARSVRAYSIAIFYRSTLAPRLLELGSHLSRCWRETVRTLGPPAIRTMVFA